MDSRPAANAKPVKMAPLSFRLWRSVKSFGGRCFGVHCFIPELLTVPGFFCTGPCRLGEECRGRLLLRQRNCAGSPNGSCGQVFGPDRGALRQGKG